MQLEPCNQEGSFAWCTPHSHHTTESLLWFWLLIPAITWDGQKLRCNICKDRPVNWLWWSFKDGFIFTYISKNASKNGTTARNNQPEPRDLTGFRSFEQSKDHIVAQLWRAVRVKRAFCANCPRRRLTDAIPRMRKTGVIRNNFPFRDNLICR